ncbi:MAG: DUF4010 domain-containing protein, partial [Aquificota bacterium]
MELNLQVINLDLLIKILLSLTLGLIIGLEREHRARTEAFAGIRTFPLITTLGCLSAFIYENYWEGIFYLTFGALVLFTVINFYLEYSKDIGITTEITSLLSFIIGVLIYYNYIYISIFLTIIITLLLALKSTLEPFAKKLSQEDIFSILKFILITAVIYPLLPDKNFGLFDAFNLKDIWKVVIIVSTLDFIGYILLKWKGGKTIWITGIIGGLVSSTAVSYELAKKAKKYNELTATAALGIAAAWTIMNFRVIVLAAIINIEIAKLVFLPLIITSIFYIIVIFYRYKKEIFKENSESINIQNPYELLSAIQFGIIYA